MKNTFLKLTAFFLLSSSVLLAGCVSMDLQKPYPDVETYTFETVRPASSGEPAPIKPVSIKVDPFSVAPGAADIFFNYRTGGATFESDFYNQTVAAPAVLITVRVRDWMKQVPFVKFVLDDDAGVKTFYVIDGKLLELYGDYRDEAHPKAVLSLECMVTRYGAGANQLLMQKTYEEAMPMNGISPKELARGWNEGLTRILTEMETDLSKTIVTDSRS